jgi:hypothetical protein
MPDRRRPAAAFRRLHRQDRGGRRHAAGEGGRQGGRLVDDEPGRIGPQLRPKMREKEAREGKERKKHEKECSKHPDKCGDYQGYRASDPD